MANCKNVCGQTVCSQEIIPISERYYNRGNRGSRFGTVAVFAFSLTNLTSSIISHIYVYKIQIFDHQNASKCMIMHLQFHFSRHDRADPFCTEP